MALARPKSVAGITIPERSTPDANHRKSKLFLSLNKIWRREWDSNPRYSFPHTRFPSVRLKPLGHLSGCPVLKGRDGFCKRPQPATAEISATD
jgi:hypothetical protein